MMKWAVKHDLLMVTGGDMFGPDLVRQADNIIWFNDKIANDPLLCPENGDQQRGRGS